MITITVEIDNAPGGTAVQIRMRGLPANQQQFLMADCILNGIKISAKAAAEAMQAKGLASSAEVLDGAAASRPDVTRN